MTPVRFVIALMISIAQRGSDEIAIIIHQSNAINGSVLKIVWKNGT